VGEGGACIGEASSDTPDGSVAVRLLVSYAILDINRRVLGAVIKWSACAFTTCVTMRSL
jgi:hypothetical protein